MKTEKPIPKEKLYATAYSPSFKCYVKIDSAWQDDRGEWIWKASNEAEGLKGYLFRDCELDNFCL